MFEVCGQLGRLHQVAVRALSGVVDDALRIVEVGLEDPLGLARLSAPELELPGAV